MKEGQPEPLIKKMPTRKQLESFMGGMLGQNTSIIFNREKGRFIDLSKPKGGKNGTR